MAESTRTNLPIDRGWAWVITFASCGLFGFIAGALKSQGVILVELLEIHPDITPKSGLWIFSLSTLISKCSGPINGFIISKTSNRTLCVTGVCLMTTCLAVFGFLPSVEYMYVVYGIGYGLGSGMVALPAYTAYASYFDKRKALSLGITTAGSGIGTIITPAILRAWFDAFPFSGAMLLYAGVCLQTLVLACLLRPIGFYERLAGPRDSSSEEATLKLDTMEKPRLSTHQDDIRVRSASIGERTPSLKQPANYFLSTPNHINYTSAPHSRKPHLSHSQLLALSAHDINGSALIFEQERADKSKDDVEEMTSNDRKINNTTFNWRLVYNPWCLALGLATLAYVSGFSVVYQCIPPLGKQSGVSKWVVSSLITGAGVLEIPVRIFNGWLADKKLMSVPAQMALYMLMVALCSLLCATISGTAGIVLMLVGMSTMGTSIMSLIPLAGGELLGSKNAQTAMSLNFVYQGLALILSTFSAGGIYERTKRWENVYYYISASQFLGCLLMTGVTITRYWISRRRQSKPSTSFLSSTVN